MNAIVQILDEVGANTPELLKGTRKLLLQGDLKVLGGHFYKQKKVLISRRLGRIAGLAFADLQSVGEGLEDPTVDLARCGCNQHQASEDTFYFVVGWSREFPGGAYGSFVSAERLSQGQLGG